MAFTSQSSHVYPTSTVPYPPEKKKSFLLFIYSLEFGHIPSGRLPKGRSIFLHLHPSLKASTKENPAGAFANSPAPMPPPLPQGCGLSTCMACSPSLCDASSPASMALLAPPCISWQWVRQTLLCLLQGGGQIPQNVFWAAAFLMWLPPGPGPALQHTWILTRLQAAAQTTEYHLSFSGSTSHRDQWPLL